jgi:hypothetical protein
LVFQARHPELEITTHLLIEQILPSIKVNLLAYSNVLSSSGTIKKPNKAWYNLEKAFPLSNLSYRMNPLNLSRPAMKKR